MSVTTRNPLRIIGGQPFSGGPNTGEQATIRGGSLAATVYSGNFALGGSGGLTGAPGAVAVGGDVQLWSGAGRLNSILIHNVIQSGLQVVFYDTSTVTSGGPFPSSGHRFLGIIPAITYGAGVASGNTFIVNDGKPINVDIPFQSGLAFNSRSGQTGFTVTWTPEVIAAFV